MISPFFAREKKRCEVDRHFINSFCQLAMHKRFYWLQCQCKKKFFLMKCSRWLLCGWKMKAICLPPLRVWISIIKLKLLWHFLLCYLAICLLPVQSKITLPRSSLFSKKTCQYCVSWLIYEDDLWMIKVFAYLVTAVLPIEWKFFSLMLEG